MEVKDNEAKANSLFQTEKIFFIFKELKPKQRKKVQGKKYRCAYKGCQKYYAHKNKMLAHIRTHFSIKPFQCKYCSKSFNEKGNLKTHIRIHTGERPYKCSQCNKSFKAYGQLKDHESSHTGLKPFQCPICSKFYRRKGILKHHMEIHKDIKISKKCFKTSLQNGKNKALTIIKKSLKCTFGNEKYKKEEKTKESSSQENLSLSHIQSELFSLSESKTNNISSLENSHSIEHDKNIFECVYCRLKFKTSDKLNKHFETHCVSSVKTDVTTLNSASDFDEKSMNNSMNKVSDDMFTMLQKDLSQNKCLTQISEEMFAEENETGRICFDFNYSIYGHLEEI